MEKEKRKVGMKNGKVKIIIIENKMKMKIGIKIEKLMDKIDKKERKEEKSCSEKKKERGFLKDLRKFGEEILKINKKIMRSKIKSLEMISKNKKERMEMKKRKEKIMLKRNEMERNRWLRKVKCMGGMGERKRIWRRVEYEKFIKVKRWEKVFKI